MRAAETDPNEARALEIIYALRASGWTNRAIVAALRELGVPARDGKSTTTALAHLRAEGVRMGGAALGWTYGDETDTAGRRIVADVQTEAETVARILAKREKP